MPRERSTESIKAEELYRGGMSLIDIADKLGKPPGTVRRWKSTQNWDDESERSETKTSVRKQNKTNTSRAIAKEVEQVINNPDLTDKQRLFCLYYSKSFNATSAYLKAYGGDYNTANAYGYKVLSNMVVREEIQRLKTERMNRELLTEADIFERYMNIAFADITDYIEFGSKEIEKIDSQGDTYTDIINQVAIKASDQVDGTLITEVSQGRDGVKVKLPDRQKALDWLAAHMDIATPEQRAKVAYIKAQTEKLNKDDTGEGAESVVIVDDIPDES